jgi:integrase
VKKWPGETLLTGADGGQLSPWALERAMRTARKKVEGLPEGFRYHDLRHYFASLLKVSAHGADVKTVQARLRHGASENHPGHVRSPLARKDESTKAVIDALGTRSSGTLRTLRGLRGARRDAPPAQRPISGQTS